MRKKSLLMLALLSGAVHAADIESDIDGCAQVVSKVEVDGKWNIDIEIVNGPSNCGPDIFIYGGATANAEKIRYIRVNSNGFNNRFAYLYIGDDANPDLIDSIDEIRMYRPTTMGDQPDPLGDFVISELFIGGDLGLDTDADAVVWCRAFGNGRVGGDVLTTSSSTRAATSTNS